MARRHRADKKVRIPDPRYDSELIARVISYVMQEGRKTTAEKVVYGALDRIREKTGEDPLEVMVKAVDNIKPRVEVKSKRVGGATYQVPVEVSRQRQLALALRWLAAFSNARRNVPMVDALAAEVMEAYRNQGNAIKKRDDTHKMAQANKAFAHYAW
ncbi:MAG: 30S ribosomal protein S7 [Kiritimatiellia bacterium]